MSGSEAQEVPGRMIYFISESIVSVQTALNIVVVKTRSGAAGAVAESLDGMAWPEVVGTLAGDNTIMIVAHDNQSAARVEEKIERLKNKAYVVPPVVRELPLAKSRHVRAVQPDMALVRGVHAAQDVQDSGLSRAGRPDDHDELALLTVKST